MLAPVCNTLIALAVVQLGWLPPAAVTLPLTSPVLVNAYLSTGGHLGGIVLQLGCWRWAYASTRPSCWRWNAGSWPTPPCTSNRWTPPSRACRTNRCSTCTIR